MREIRGKYIVKRSIHLLLCVLLIVLASVGCSKQEAGPDILKKMGKDEKATIKVMYGDESYFYQRYGNLFASKYPNIEIEVLDTRTIAFDTMSSQTEAYEKFIEQHQPDVIVIDSNMYEELASKGIFLELDSVIKNDGFDVDSFVPSIIEMLRVKGQGKLYGLAPTFSSSALFYNQDLFEIHGIDPPQDQMSWQDVLALASRFPTDGSEEDRVYGYAVQEKGAFGFIHFIALTQGLMFISPDGEQVVINSEPWRQVLSTAVDALRSDTIYLPAMKDMTDDGMISSANLFYSGRAAMMVGNSFQLAQLKNLDRDAAAKGKSGFRWDVVTMPVDPANPEYTAAIGLQEIFGIHAKSENARAAWELVSFINGEELAKLYSKSMGGALQTRTAFVQDDSGRKLESFYKLKPNFDVMRGFEHMPIAFIGAFAGIMEQSIHEVLGDKLTLEEAVQSMQEQGELALKQARESSQE